jgi:hypothetical protein
LDVGGDGKLKTPFTCYEEAYEVPPSLGYHTAESGSFTYMAGLAIDEGTELGHFAIDMLHASTWLEESRAALMRRLERNRLLPECESILDVVSTHDACVSLYREAINEERKAQVEVIKVKQDIVLQQQAGDTIHRRQNPWRRTAGSSRYLRQVPSAAEGEAANSTLPEKEETYKPKRDSFHRRSLKSGLSLSAIISQDTSPTEGPTENNIRGQKVLAWQLGLAKTEAGSLLDEHSDIAGNGLEPFIRPGENAKSAKKSTWNPIRLSAAAVGKLAERISKMEERRTAVVRSGDSLQHLVSELARSIEGFEDLQIAMAEVEGALQNHKEAYSRSESMSRDMIRSSFKVIKGQRGRINTMRHQVQSEGSLSHGELPEMKTLEDSSILSQIEEVKQFQPLNGTISPPLIFSPSNPPSTPVGERGQSDSPKDAQSMADSRTEEGCAPPSALEMPHKHDLETQTQPDGRESEG